MFYYCASNGHIYLVVYKAWCESLALFVKGAAFKAAYVLGVILLLFDRNAQSREFASEVCTICTCVHMRTLYCSVIELLAKVSYTYAVYYFASQVARRHVDDDALHARAHSYSAVRFFRGEVITDVSRIKD